MISQIPNKMYLLNSKIKVAVTGLMMLFSMSIMAQEKKPWKNKKCAVSLTYDDALNVHLDNAVPILDSLGLKGTFYLSGYSGALTKRIDQWRAVAKKGHELANHTLYHPCSGKPEGRSFVTPDYDLETYSVRRITDEMKMTNALLKAIDGKSKRTFAYPCGDTLASGKPYYSQAKSEFVSARGVKSEYVTLTNFKPDNVGSFMISGQTGDQLISMVKKAMETNTAIVFLFHGVGGEHGLNVSLKAHRELLRFLKKQEKDIWVAPFLDIAEYALAQKKATPKAVAK